MADIVIDASDPTTVYENALEYADANQITINDFLARTGMTTAGVVNIGADGGGINVTIPEDATIDALEMDIANPTIADLVLPVFNEQVAPPDPDLADITRIDFSGIPGYDIAPLVLDLPERPAIPVMPALGDAPPVSDIPIPNAPSLMIPAVPVLREIAIPAPPDMEIVPFEGVMPVDNIGAVDMSFSYSEGIYTSDLLTNVKAKLNDLVVNGGTGYDAEWEDIWNREKERADLALQEAKDKVSAEWAERGFDLPTGVLTSLLLALDTEYLNQRATSGRDVAIKQIEVAKEETQFALKTGVELEGALMSFASSVAQRQLEAAKATTEYGIALINARIAKYAAELDAYKTTAVVYEARIKGMLARAEVYKAQIDAQRLINELNMSDVELYKALVSTSQIYIEMYKTEMEAANIRAGIERLKIETFKAQVEAFIAKVQYNASLFSLYDSAVKGELAKAQVYATQIEGYKARVEASKVEADIIMSDAQTDIAIEKMKLEKFMTLMQAFEIKVKQESARCEVVIEGDKVLIGKYGEDIKAWAAEMDAEVRRYAAGVEATVGMAQVAATNAKTAAELASAAMMASVEAAKAAAQCAAQIAASALASVTTSTAFHTQYQGNTDFKHIDTANTNWNYNYSR